MHRDLPILWHYNHEEKVKQPLLSIKIKAPGGLYPRGFSDIETKLVEAEGIAPSSKENLTQGSYRLTPCFVLIPSAPMERITQNDLS